MGGFTSKHSHLTAVHDATCGPVKGVGYDQEDGSVVEGFLGVPYAEPPIGALRFKKPIAHRRWEEPLECTKFGPRAPQNDELLGQFVNTVGKSEEHCLSLNVFTPKWESDEWPNGFPVMVFIHGGGFQVHSSSNYGCATIARNLCTKNVVAVTINYRLGVLGFFTTGDSICPGNMGLWDQTAALQWVQDHIASFRGDPDNVTIFGQSAGGASVDLLCLSPHSNRLFNRAIPMAGNAECDFAIRTSKQQATCVKSSQDFWDGREVVNDDSEGLLDFIDNQPLYKLEMGINPRRGFRHSQAGSLYFVPNFDGDFFPKPLSQLREEVPKMQLMTGTTKYEGLFFIALGALSRNPEGIKKFMSRIFKKCDYGENSEEALELAYNFYFKGVHPKDQEKNIQQIVKFIGDYSINYGTYLFANKMSELDHDVYFYQFEYHNPGGFGIFRWLLPFLGEFLFSKFCILGLGSEYETGRKKPRVVYAIATLSLNGAPIPSVRGSTHCTEMRYVLGKGIISKFKPNESDKKMIEVMTTYFTNFAKYGSPNGQIDSDSGQWEKHDSFTPFRHFKIDLEDSEMAEDYQDRRAELWDKLRALNVTRAQL
ncbi:Protein CBG22005 [Caenorhabditis briggsae]|uniref:Carboxylic ester hydrolase n=1 Tax=Caenorhabditis briggsae TaxID=6238 RepID=A8Y1B5_CAEBR|nr:Protein CBG22005 [Caenorhabditis briggsae]CAP38684.2 Protein CBG22005 [Caenorhabditis briggsae]